MRAIVLIGINFVRTQWIALAVMCAYVLGIGGIYRVHTQREEILFFLRWHAGYAIFFATMIAIPALQTERKTRRILAVLSKGIHRWQYLGRPVVRMRDDCCVVLFSDRRNRSMAGPAGQNSRGWIGCDYDAAFLLLRPCDFPRAVFCDVLSSAAGHRSHRQPFWHCP